MSEQDREVGAPGRRSSVWGPGLLAFVAVVVFGATSAGMAAGWSEAGRRGAEAGAAGGSVEFRFEHASASMDALGEETLRGLAVGDTTGLERLRLTEHEHNDIVWPELPASAVEINYPVDYAWTNIENRNRRAVARNLETFAGRAASVEGVECRGGIEAFRTFRVHTRCYVIFTVRGDLKRWQSQLFKDVVERGGGFKIFRYYDAEPEPYRAHTVAEVP